MKMSSFIFQEQQIVLFDKNIIFFLSISILKQQIKTNSKLHKMNSGFVDSGLGIWSDV